MNNFLKKLFFGNSDTNFYYLNVIKNTAFSLEEWKNFEEGGFQPFGVLLFHPLGHPIDERLITFLVKIDSNQTSIDRVVDIFKRRVSDIHVETITDQKNLEKYRLFIEKKGREEMNINDIEILLHKIEGVIYDFVQPNGQIEIYLLPSKTSIDKIIDLLNKNGYNAIKK